MGKYKLEEKIAAEQAARPKKYTPPWGEISSKKYKEITTGTPQEVERKTKKYIEEGK